MPTPPAAAAPIPASPVRIAASQHGQGLFAVRAIAEDEIVGEVTGQVIDDAGYGSEYGIDMGDNLTLEPAAPFRFLNHSCEPNCCLFLEDPPRSKRGAKRGPPKTYVETIRPVLEGEELTIDYGWSADAAIPCGCGAKACRGWVVAAGELKKLRAAHAKAAKTAQVDAAKSKRPAKPKPLASAAATGAPARSPKGARRRA